MQRFAFLEAKYNADVRPRLLVNDVSLTVHPTGTAVISYCSRLPKAEAVVGVAMMFGILELGWSGYQFRFRFPLSDDPPPISKRAGKARRDFRQAFRWAAFHLIPEHLLREIEREGHQPWILCERESVTPELVACRLGVLPPMLTRA